jgi:hypothetical protein
MRTTCEKARPISAIGANNGLNLCNKGVAAIAVAVERETGSGSAGCLTAKDSIAKVINHAVMLVARRRLAIFSG